MKKGFRLLVIAFLLVIVVAAGIISASITFYGDYPSDSSNCGITYRNLGDIGSYSDFGHYDYGKFDYCRNSRGESYICYKQYNNYQPSYDEYYNYYYRTCQKEYTDNYGNIIRVTRNDCDERYYYNSCDEINNPYYVQDQVESNSRNGYTKPVAVYVY
ncbi:Uncharacterised protein [uncultured archaeon]|nr:Uncharacterised protein [uncultured archaeon]